MKLLLVPSRFPYGPKEAFLREEIAQLSRSFDVSVVPAVPAREPLTVPSLARNAQRLRLGSPSVLRLALAEAVSHPFRAARAFASVIGAPSALHAKIKNLAVFPTALATARIARRDGIEHVHAYWLSAPATVAFVVSQLTKIPWSATGHRYDLVDFNVRSVGRPRIGFFRSAQFVRTISQQGADRLRHLGAAGTPVRVIHLGVSLPPRRERKLDTTLHLVCAANLEAVKGHETLLAALQIASREADVRATIVGDGTLRRELQARVHAMQLDERVTFEGVVPHERLLERLSSPEFDAAILTSVDEGPAQREGIPVFLMEAMARGLPVIATRSGAVSELANEDNALLCEPGNAVQIARAIVTLATDLQLRVRLSNAGRARVERDFDVRTCAMELVKAIRNKRDTRRVTSQGVEISA